MKAPSTGGILTVVYTHRVHSVHLYCIEFGGFMLDRVYIIQATPESLVLLPLSSKRWDHRLV